jgi:type II secretory pathway component PulF
MGIFGPLSLLVLIPMGVALLWAVQLLYRARGAADDPLRLILTLAGWIMIVVGLIGTATHLLFVVSPVGWIVVLMILAMAVARYRALERRSLLWSLALAAEKGIPLEQAARAFADERVDEMGIRANRLAGYLEAGMPLNDALRASRTWLPTDALVAVRLGSETGHLAPALTHIATPDDELNFLLRSVFEKFIYLAIVVNVLLMILTFMMLKIVPVFAKMFEEFELDLPSVTVQLIAFAEFGVTVLALPMLLLFLIVLVLGMLFYIGWLPRDFPGLNWFALRTDAAVVMRCLALGVRKEIPLNRMVAKLARLYPRSSVRRRLAVASRSIDDGRPWIESLQRSGLFGHADVGVLQAAERVGNLAWALDERADSSVRRFALRMRVLLNILFPSVLVVFGIVIAFNVVGLFIPLVSLIQGLS